MSRAQSIRWQEWCFCWAVLLLPFGRSPLFEGLNFLLGYTAKQLSFLPLLVGIALGCVTQYRYRDFFPYRRAFFWYALLSLVTGCASLLWGIAIFPWWGTDAGLPGELLTTSWVMDRVLRDVLFPFLWSFVVAYWVFCLFYQRPDRGIQLTCTSILWILGIMAPYFVVEICWLYSGASWAADLLATLNPLFYSVGKGYDWWPPLFWKGQLRGFFAEPSYLGGWFVLIFPLLWWRLIFQARRRWPGILICCACFILICLTKARTAICLTLGELALLFLLNCWIRQRHIFLPSCTLIGGFIIACSLVSQYPTPDTPKPDPDRHTRQISFLYDNALNVFSLGERSNQARYGSMLAHIGTGMVSPLLGTGPLLYQAYLPEHVPPSARQNNEIRTWIHLQKERGFIASSIPSMCAYTTLFAQKGLVGLIIFLFPLGLCAWLLGRRLHREKNGKWLALVLCMSVTFFGSCVLGFSMELRIFGFWIFLGLAFLVAVAPYTPQEGIDSATPPW